MGVVTPGGGPAPGPDPMLPPAGAGWTVVRSSEGAWAAARAGVAVRRLFLDAAEERLTAVARMEAGAQYPGHEHADTEEVYVLSGDLTVEGQVLLTGDYSGAPTGTVHSGARTDGGCSLLIMSSGRDRIVDREGSGEPKTGLVFVRSSEGVWREGRAQGVAVRPLYSDPARGTTTALVRMRAGSRLPRSRQGTAEQIYMVDGRAQVAGQALQVGDYCRAAAGAPPAEIHTDGGCLFLLNASREEVPA